MLASGEVLNVSEVFRALGAVFLAVGGISVLLNSRGGD
jgi:hypothetical protein